MTDPFSRTRLLLGDDAMQILKSSSVAVFGVGGVGSYVAEALARSGVGTITLFDKDTVSVTNINRQLIALHSTVGREKTDVMKERILDINPVARVIVHPVFYGADNADEFDLSRYSYIVDAIDTVSSKLLLIERAQAAGVPIMSSMGAGNKLDPTAFEVADIYKTSVCPLAKVMRRELRARGVESLKVVYSREMPVPHSREAEIDCLSEEDGDQNVPVKRQVPGSVAFVPSVAGLILAGEVIKDLIHIRSDRM